MKNLCINKQNNKVENLLNDLEFNKLNHAIVNKMNDDEINLILKSSLNEIYAIKVLESDRIIDIKRKVSDKIGLEIYFQDLYFNGQILEDNELLGNMKIVNNFCINFNGKLCGGMNISVKTFEGKIYTFEVTSTETVADIKAKVYEKSGIFPKSIKLVFRGSVLFDHDIIKDVDISDKSTINMVIMQNQENDIVVELSKQKSLKLKWMETDKVVDIKENIYQLIGIDVKSQRLLFKGQLLENNKTLTDYEIQTDDVLNLVYGSKSNYLIFSILTVFIVFIGYELLRIFSL